MKFWFGFVDTVTPTAQNNFASWENSSRFNPPCVCRTTAKHRKTRYRGRGGTPSRRQCGGSGFGFCFGLGFGYSFYFCFGCGLGLRFGFGLGLGISHCLQLRFGLRSQCEGAAWIENPNIFYIIGKLGQNRAQRVFCTWTLNIAINSI